jgi:hypothetical protein
MLPLLIETEVTRPERPAAWEPVAGGVRDRVAGSMRANDMAGAGGRQRADELREGQQAHPEMTGLAAARRPAGRRQGGP